MTPRATLVGRRVAPAFGILVVVLLASGACGPKRARAPAPPSVAAGGEEVGVASWYGHPYHGRRTASGEIYDMERLTAAHRTRPLHSWVRVINLHNGKTVEVRINDRGPFVDGRIIDLSKAAARQIEMIGPGTTWVRLESIAAPTATSSAAPVSAATSVVPSATAPVGATSPPPVAASPAAIPPPRVPMEAPPALQVPSAGEASHPPDASLISTGRFAVQAGAFQLFENADRLRAQMEAEYGSARILARDGQPTLWRVLVGAFDRIEEAEAIANTIRETGAQAFPVRMDDPPGAAPSR